MDNMEKVIKELERTEIMLKQAVDRGGEMAAMGAFICYNHVSDALALLKEQGESIPVSWLKEKLEGHPELSYAVTDGIINVLDLWEER